MHIDGGRIDGTVPQESLEGQQIHAVLVTVCGKSVAERMGSEPPINAQQIPLLQDTVLNPLLVHRAAPHEVTAGLVIAIGLHEQLFPA